MSNPFKHTISARQKIIYSKNIETEGIYVADMTFEGPIFNRKIVDEFGLPNKVDFSKTNNVKPNSLRWRHLFYKGND